MSPNNRFEGTSPLRGAAPQPKRWATEGDWKQVKLGSSRRRWPTYRRSKSCRHIRQGGFRASQRRTSIHAAPSTFGSHDDSLLPLVPRARPVERSSSAKVLPAPFRFGPCLFAVSGRVHSGAMNTSSAASSPIRSAFQADALPETIFGRARKWPSSEKEVCYVVPSPTNRFEGTHPLRGRAPQPKR
jgi:hypothetical protein